MHTFRTVPSGSCVFSWGPVRGLPDYRGYWAGGVVTPLAKGRARADGFEASRPLGGWVAVYGLIRPDGQLDPVVDRDGQVIEAAATPDNMDVSTYLTSGVWTDTHRAGTRVGLPTELEWHGADSPLAKSHGKVGWYTCGHLFDRHDPSSWEAFGLERPAERDLDRADAFWRAAKTLTGTGRPLGFSAEGRMRLSPDRRRIVWAELTDAAVCELPVNPATTAEPIEALRKAVLDSRRSVHATAHEHREAPLKPSDLDEHQIEQLIESIMRRYLFTKEQATRFVHQFVASATEASAGGSP